MKIKILISICFLIIGCSLNELVDNENMKNSIDNLEFSKKIIEVEVDFIGNFMDTISIEQLKFDSKDNKRFKKKEYWYKERKSSWINYFKPDGDLFFREAFDDEGKSNSIFETFSNKNGEVEKAIQINKERELIDTTFMEYSRNYYQNKNVKTLIIKTFHEEVGELISKVKYNEQGEPIFEVMIMEDDTMSSQTWEYSDTILQSSIYTNYQRDTSKTIYFFGERELLSKEEEFEFRNGFFMKSKEIHHIYNKEDDRIRTIEKNLKSNDVKYKNYIIQK